MVQLQHLDKADAIRQQHEDRNNAIRARTELTADAQRALIAKNYLAAKDRMGTLQQTAGDETAATMSSAGRTAFGTSDIPGDPASVSISYRDAQDRADSLNDPNDAARLLARAEQSGDEPLARAVAAKSFEMHSARIGAGNSAWASVVDDYTATRPRAATAVQTLAELGSRPNTTRELFSYVLPKPPELGNVSDYQLPALAAGTP